MVRLMFMVPKADQATLDQLEIGMAHYAKLMSAITGKDISLEAGSGAAGGLGAASLVCFGSLKKESISFWGSLAQNLIFNKRI